MLLTHRFSCVVPSFLAFFEDRKVIIQLAKPAYLFLYSWWWWWGGRVTVQSAYFYSPTPAPRVKYILANFSFQKRSVKQPIRYIVIRAPSYWLPEGPVLWVVVKFKCSVEMPQYISFFLKITGNGDQKSCSGGRKRSQSVLKTTAICKTR